MRLFGLWFLADKAFAHGGHEYIGSPWWQMWNFDALILFSLLSVFLLYVIGRLKMRNKNFWHSISFYTGLVVLFLALISPIDPLSDLLASVHMLQHTLLMMVAAPLMVVGAPTHTMLWVMPAAAGRKLLSVRRFIRPLLAWSLYSLTLWIWHLPYLYEAALQIPWVHDLQHLAFFITSFLFWSVLFDPFQRKLLHPGAGILYLFVASLHSMILGVLMALSPSVWYESYLETAPLYGLSALEDQQLAGLIMWMPAGLAYVVAVAVLLFRLIFLDELKVSNPQEANRSNS